MADQGYEPEPPADTAAGEPFWKNKWVLGGAAALGALVIWQMNQRGPEIQTVPINIDAQGNPVDAQGNPIPPAGPGRPGQPGPWPGAPAGPGGPGVPGQPAVPGQPITADQPAPAAPTYAPPAPAADPSIAPGVSPAQGDTVDPDEASYEIPGRDTGRPFLVPPGSRMPEILAQHVPQSGWIIEYQFRRNGAILGGMTVLPERWDAGPSGFTFVAGNGTMNSQHSVSSTYPSLVRGANGPSRVASLSFDLDGARMGGMCVSFTGQQGQRDVVVRGSTMCLMDRACQRVIACGRIR